VNDSIFINAKTSIVLKAGQSSITLQGANITMACPGTFSVKGSGLSLDAGGSGAAALPVLPTEQYKLNDEAFLLVNKLNGQPVADVAYTIDSPTGAVMGRTGEDGMTHRVATGSASYLIRVTAYADENPLADYVSGTIEGC
jgi:type VI secretion system secreted protein VgrG